MKKGHRLRAPSNDGGLLAVTPLAEVAAHFTRTAARLAGWDHDLLRPHAISSAAMNWTFPRSGRAPATP